MAAGAGAGRRPGPRGRAGGSNALLTLLSLLLPLLIAVGCLARPAMAAGAWDDSGLLSSDERATEDRLKGDLKELSALWKPYGVSEANLLEALLEAEDLDELLDSWDEFAVKLAPLAAAVPGASDACAACAPQALWAVLSRVLRVTNKATEDFCEKKGWDNHLCKLMLASPQLGGRLLLKQLSVSPLAVAKGLCEKAGRCEAAAAPA